MTILFQSVLKKHMKMRSKPQTNKKTLISINQGQNRVWGCSNKQQTNNTNKEQTEVTRRTERVMMRLISEGTTHKICASFNDDDPGWKTLIVSFNFQCPLAPIQWVLLDEVNKVNSYNLRKKDNKCSNTNKLLWKEWNNIGYFAKLKEYAFFC